MCETRMSPYQLWPDARDALNSSSAMLKIIIFYILNDNSPNIVNSCHILTIAFIILSLVLVVVLSVVFVCFL